MAHEASPKSPPHPESPASPQWDNCSASNSDSFSDSNSDASDADSEGVAEEWTATLPVGDKADLHAAVFPEDQDAFFRKVLEEGYLRRFESADAIFIACLQAMYRTLGDSQETHRQDIKLLQKQLDCERLAKEKLSQELQIVQSKLDLIESMRSDVKLLQNGFEQSLHKLQAAQQDIETGKIERAKLSQDLHAAQDEIITAEEELGEKEEQVVTIQNLLVNVEIAQNELEKSVKTKFGFLQEIINSMQTNLQPKEGFLTERNKLRSEVETLQSQVVAMHNGIQSREQNDNKCNAAIHCRIDDQEQQVAILERDGRHHFKAYQSLKDFTDMVAGKLPQIENLQTLVDAHNEGIQSQERTSVTIFKALQTRIDDHDQVLRRIQKKFPSYATTDSVDRISNLLATRIDDCTIESGQNFQWLRDSFDSQIASIDTALKEVTTKFGFFSIASVPNLHERIDATKEYIDFVDGRVKAVDQRVQLDSHRIVHVGQHVGVVERQIGEIQTQNAELQEENTKLRCIVEQQGSMLKQISNHIMSGEDNPSVLSSAIKVREPEKRDQWVGIWKPRWGGQYR
ncbi:hypothetical protein E2P81_ATG04837 [Venturia nashicola]|uniref:Uncharacterized protein n=1 Tax=Venturia nashicola TaxID=86259 RepID=A0A4Z1P2E2_9PEZI|nr:hypothetical protein E6O75_ATG04958 [Venturia nashicola]TLD34672.1 hypothetical protein E2P81_ATG04837 [Venturia nashicola]